MNGFKGEATTSSMASVLNKLANETWMQIFENEVLTSGDLCNVARTCHRFYALSIGALMAHITWRNPKVLAHSLPLWTRSPHLIHFPRSVSISTSPVRRLRALERSAGREIVRLDGSLASYPPAPPLPPMLQAGQVQAHFQFAIPEIMPRYFPRYSADPELYGAMLDRLRSFTHLDALTFTKCFLPSEFHLLLHELPNLRRLKLECVTLPQTDPDSIPAGGLAAPLVAVPPDQEIPDHSLLPLTDLILHQLEGAQGDGAASNMHAILRLATAHNLRRIAYDQTAKVSPLFTTVDSPYIVPQGLIQLRVHMPLQKDWPTDQTRTMERYINPLVHLLQKCPALRRLVVMNFMPPFELPPGTLPSLRAYTGPLATVQSLASKLATIEVLHINDRGKSVRQVLGALGTLGRERSCVLQELSLTVPEWDDELVHAITQMFPTLTTLCLKYESGGPSEDTMIGLGARHLANLPGLRTLKMYNPMAHRPRRRYEDGEQTSRRRRRPLCLDDYTPPSSDSAPLMHALQQFQYPPSNTVFGHNFGLGLNGIASVPAAATDDEDEDDSSSSENESETESIAVSLPEEAPEDAARAQADEDEQLYEILAVWRRYCPELREVRFVPRYTYRRAFDGDVWAKRVPSD